MLYDNFELERPPSDYAKIAARYVAFATSSGIKYLFLGVSVSSTWAYSKLNTLTNRLDPRASDSSKKNDARGCEEASACSPVPTNQDNKGVEEVALDNDDIKCNPNKPESDRCGEEMIDRFNQSSAAIDDCLVIGELIQKQMEDQGINRLKVASNLSRPSTLKKA